MLTQQRHRSEWSVHGESLKLTLRSFSGAIIALTSSFIIFSPLSFALFRASLSIVFKMIPANQRASLFSLLANQKARNHLKTSLIILSHLAFVTA